MRESIHVFSRRIYKVGIIRYVDVPAEVSREIAAGEVHVDAGAVVEVALERDEEPREPAVPPALAMALRLAPRAQAEFRGMTTALRRQIVRFIMSAKQEATRDRRARMAVRLLMARVERKKKPRRTSRWWFASSVA